MKDISKEITKASEELQVVMMANLFLISENIIFQIMARKKRLNPSKYQDAIKKIKPKGINEYKNDLQAAIAAISSDSLDQVKSEIPSKRNIQLMENEERLLFGEFEKLPANIRNRIKASNDLLIGTQIADLEKAMFFQFGDSVYSEKPDKEIERDLKEKADKYIEGNAIKTGATLTATKTVNEVRNAFFFTKEVLEEIEAFEFMNSNPISAICRDLVGTIFSKNDPNHYRYTAPLHYNCKSWIRPMLKLKKNQKIEKLEPSTKEIKDSVQF